MGLGQPMGYRPFSSDQSDEAGMSSSSPKWSPIKGLNSANIVDYRECYGSALGDSRQQPAKQPSKPAREQPAQPGTTRLVATGSQFVVKNVSLTHMVLPVFSHRA